MNIAIFSYVFAPEKFLVNSLAETLAKSHNIQVSTGLPNYPKGDILDGYSYMGPYRENINGADVLRYPVTPRKTGAIFLALNYFTNFFFGTLNILRLNKKNDAVFVFATSPIMTAIPAIFYARWRKVPVFIWLQDLWPESFNAIVGGRSDSFVSKALGVMVRWIYKNTNVMLIQSEGFKANLKEYEFKGKVHWLPNWANDTKASVNPKWVDDVPKDKFVITFAGNIGVAQKLDTLLKAAKELEANKEIFFAIVGDGREHERLVSEYSELKNVKFYGRQAPEDMMPLFEASSALVVMLKNDPVFALTIPSKLQSYLKAKKPIICSLSGEGEKLVRENSLGVVSNVEDYKDLAQKILDLYHLPLEDKEELGANCFKLYESHFEANKVISNIENLLGEYVSKCSR